MMIKEVRFSKAEYGYSVDVVGNTERDSFNVGIYEYKKEAQKIAREKANELKVLLRTDWDNEIQQPLCLDSILQMMGSKSPLRSKPIKYIADGVERKDWLTKSGWSAYERLTSLLYGIGTVCEVDVEKIVEILDTLVESDIY